MLLDLRIGARDVEYLKILVQLWKLRGLTNNVTGNFYEASVSFDKFACIGSSDSLTHQFCVKHVW
jgi:hypothetical protein